MWQILKRLDIHYKRARSYIHSPDPHYDEKVVLIKTRLEQARKAPERFVFLYQDECHYYRQPTLASAYALKGTKQPLARKGYGGNPSMGITCLRATHRQVGCLNALTGQTTYEQHSRIRIDQIVGFYRTLGKVYPKAEQIYLVQDNLPIHFHPNVLVHLQPQNWLWTPTLPDNWPSQPTVEPTQPELPIQILILPTYASWLNPIEKLWRWLKQTVIHLHAFADNWEQLKQQVAAFLDQFLQGSKALLRYTGLWHD